jgi:hypothetical protein
MDNTVLFHHRMAEAEPTNSSNGTSPMMAVSTGPLVERREKILAIMPHISGSLSMLASLAIIYYMYQKVKRKQKFQSYHAIMLIMSIIDVAASFAFALGTLPMPQGPAPKLARPYRYGAVGNQATCITQGITIEFGILIIILNVVLSMHYLLSIRWRWREPQLQNFTKIALLTSFFITLVITVALWFIKGYNYNPLWCWIGPNLLECKSKGLSESECFAQALVRRNIFYFAPLLTCTFITTIIQVMIIWTVRSVEKKAGKWRFQSQKSSSSRNFIQKRKKYATRTKTVAVQSILYLSSFYVCWIPHFIAAIVLQNQSNLLMTNYFWIMLCVSIFQPLQGFLNGLIFFRTSISAALASTASRLSLKVVTNQQDSDLSMQVSNLQTSTNSLEKLNQYRTSNDDDPGGDVANTNQEIFEIENPVIDVKSNDGWEVTSLASTDTNGLSIDDDGEMLLALYGE